MIIPVGNFFFRYRNGLFPVVYLLLFIPSRPLFADFWVALVLGILAAASGQLIRAVTVGLEYIIRGGRNRRVYAEELVQGGVYAYCRNPLYVGNALILVGVGLASNSRLFMGVALPFFAFAYWAIIAAEENYLRGKFGQRFDDYCRRVNRFWPARPDPEHRLVFTGFNWRRLITAEYGSAYIWIAAVLVVTLKNAWHGGHFDSVNPLGYFLGGALVVVSIGYGLARFLKKSGRLNSNPNPSPKPAQ